MAKHAFLLLSDPANPGKFANPLTYAAQLDEAGHEVAVYFDGPATTWFDGHEERAPPAVEAYERAKAQDLIAGVCDHLIQRGSPAVDGGRESRKLRESNNTQPPANSPNLYNH